MDLSLIYSRLLVFLWTTWTYAEIPQNNCTNYHLQFEWVFSVPGHVAMLNSTLVSRRYFDYTTVPYNITWYNLKTGQEMINQTDKVFVLRETMWFLNVTLEDNGEYVTILRTPSRCFMQSTKLVVEPPIPGECGKPQKAYQELQAGVAHLLNCPLMDYIQKLKSYDISSTITWSKDCTHISDETEKYQYRDSTKLNIDGVDSHHSGLYTCVLTFTLDGVVGSVSETINATVKDREYPVPQIFEPANETIKAKEGSRFTKKCLVFVPTVGQSLDPIWFVRDLKASNKTSERIYVSEKMSRKHDAPAGFLVERLLIFSKVTAEDFNLNYTCLVMSSRVQPPAYFTLIPVEPDLILPVGCVFGSLILVFIMSVTIFYTFRISIVLWFRETFSILYTDKDLDGKLYDAYVAYSQPQPVGFEEEVEKFALHTLPQVLEETWGYKLFIEGRDGLPGQSKVDSVEENIQASRCFILLYTASTFICRQQTNGTCSNSSDKTRKTQSTCDRECSESMHHLECVAAMHRSLLEGSLKVVLVELEELSSDQLALLPESVQHLRKKQGAVCLWKNVAASKRWRKCLRTEEDEEDGGKDSYLSASFCPSSRFWKEVRYQMPVKGRRRVGSRETVLLNK
ncbi:interleukin-1 receptor type 1 [Oryzias melastigma]|uniref:interleukin-1 receptor type 1 n=1 Tax=Oryzias melastigma TaxID=30732 RepID=UPI00168D41A3|nr:interleukin-1 receptor type 1 [Oryzias melastigma]